MRVTAVKVMVAKVVGNRMIFLFVYCLPQSGHQLEGLSSYPWCNGSHSV